MEDGKNLDSHISLAMDIGMQMLVCGAQISRVEDSIGRICKALGCPFPYFYRLPVSMSNDTSHSPPKHLYIHKHYASRK